jgi:hypothetical protein
VLQSFQIAVVADELWVKGLTIHDIKTTVSTMVTFTLFTNTGVKGSIYFKSRWGTTAELRSRGISKLYSSRINDHTSLIYSPNVDVGTAD